MDKNIKKLSKNNAGSAIECIRKGIDFNMKISNQEFIMFVGGILSKIKDGQQFFYIRERGWVGI